MTDSTPPKKRRWLAYTLAGVVALVTLFVIYAGLSLSWAYSEGERAGNLRKFSRKGWLCKTWEGEVAQSISPGMAPEIWYFTVRDARVVPQIQAAVGRDVTLHCKEHRGVPTSCFGDTPYFVDSLEVVQ